MNHLSEERLYAAQLEPSLALDAGEQAHLAECALCAVQAGQIGALLRSLRVAQRSLPSPAALQQLYALGAQVERDSLSRRLGAWVRATLALDTRATAVSAGVRGALGSYRLLYSTEAADVELMVERTNDTLRVEGEVLPLHDTAGALPVLVQMEGAQGVVADLESEADGRFALDAVLPGSYRLWLSFAGAGDVVIEDLEIG